MVKKKSKILLIDPLNNFDLSNTVGLAFLRGYLTKKKIENDIINFNRVIEKKHELTYREDIKNFLSNQNIYSQESSFLKNRSLYFLLIRLYYFGPEIIWKAAEEIKAFDKLFESYSDKFKPFSYVGISITYSDQVLFSLLLMMFIKRKMGDTKIIIGGSLVTSSIDDFIKLLSIEPIVDFIVTGEGETPLKKIIGNEKRSEIPNILYLENREYRKSKSQMHFENYSDLPSPIFEKKDRVLLQYSRKCYWGKCTYCIADSYHYNPKYANRKISKVVTDIKTNNERLGSNTGLYHFIDSALPKRFFVDFYEALKDEAKIKNKYSAYIRFDDWVEEDILIKVKKTGFSHLKGGIETTVDRLQNILNKGYKRENFFRILDLYKKFNFSVCLMFMIGLPTQTKEELKEDLDVIKIMLRKYSNISTLEITPLSIKKETDIFNNSKKYKIEILDKTNVFLGNHFSFRQLEPGAISTQEAIELTKKYIKKNLEKHKKKVFLWS